MSTLQSALCFTIVFFVIVSCVAAGPILYIQADSSARLFALYKNNLINNKEVMSTDSIHYGSASADSLYCSAERLQYIVYSVTDAVRIVVREVKSF
ncbi:MAG: hypothetical protein GXY06_07650 [Clostridiaceae bacterium]|nr:hypothetical protein [Clostridiaceae bacterium]